MKRMKIMATCLILLFSFGLHFAQTNEVIVQSIEPNLTETLLTQAAEILSHRLKAAQVTLISQDVQEDGTIHLYFDGQLSEYLGKALFTSRGSLQFRATIDRGDFLQSIAADHPIYQLLGIQRSTAIGQEKTTARLTDVDLSVRANVDAYLRSNEFEQVEFAWGLTRPDAQTIPLYLLKNTIDPAWQLTDKSLVACSYKGPGTIALTFDHEGRDKLAEISSKHKGQPLAITIDGKVVMAPTIQTTITGGKLHLTGDFSEEDGHALAALLQHGPLPVQFKSIK